MLAFIVTLVFLGLVDSYSSKSGTLIQILANDSCGISYPPPHVIPQNCNVNVSRGDLVFSDETVEVYLCLALLEVKTHMCALKNTSHTQIDFNTLLNDSHSDEGEDKLCDRMATLVSDQLRPLYESFRKRTCYNVCFSLKSDVADLRKSLCKTLLKGHNIMLGLASLTASSAGAVKSESGIPQGEQAAQGSQLSVPGLAISDPPSLSSQDTYLLPQMLMKKAGELKGEAISNAEKFINLKAHNVNNVSNFANTNKAQIGPRPQENIEKPDGDLSFSQGREHENKSASVINNDANALNQDIDTNLDISSIGQAKSQPQATDKLGQEKGNPAISNNTAHTGSEGNPNPHLGSKDTGVESKKDLEIPTDKEDGNEAGDTPNTNGGDGIEDRDDASLQDPNHLQGETDDDDDDDGADDKEKKLPKGSELSHTAQQSTKFDDAISKNDGPLPSSEQFGYHGFVEAEDSHFFAYFMSLSAFFIICYLAYHNKRKIIAIAVEGKKGRNSGRRRPHSASYHKLDSNLEEAMSSNVTSTNSYVIY